MTVRERIQCDCGQELKRPIPRTCPACGAEIGGLRRRGPRRWRYQLLILAMFAALVLYVVWLAGGL